MEEEKRKKKHKKKKSKQTKTTEGESVGLGESASADQNHANGIEHDHQSQVSETSDVQSDVVQKMDVVFDGHHSNGTEGSILAEAEKQYWLDREASLEEEIKQLQNKRDAHIQKEADLEMKILNLQSEKDSWLQKEAGFEEKINQLVDESATLSLKGVSLEQKIKQLERERDSWVVAETLAKETITSLNGDNTRLQAQVMELEESRNNLLQENQLLIESQIQYLERSTASAHLSTDSTMRASENKDMNLQMEAAQALVEKLPSENTELVEKVNELYVELGRRCVTYESVGSDPVVETTESARVAENSALESDPMAGAAVERPESSPVPDPIFESSERTSVSDGRMESPEDMIKSKRVGGNEENTKATAEIQTSPETMESEEIVQIPLDENEVRETGLEAFHSDDKVDVPLSDAPLLGAPFRFISFFARYVSGADLINKNSINEGL